MKHKIVRIEVVRIVVASIICAVLFFVTASVFAGYGEKKEQIVSYSQTLDKNMTFAQFQAYIMKNQPFPLQLKNGKPPYVQYLKASNMYFVKLLGTDNRSLHQWRYEKTTGRLTIFTTSTGKVWSDASFKKMQAILASLSKL